jgi:hypothetical protein
MQHGSPNRASTNRLRDIFSIEQTGRIYCPLLGLIDGPGTRHTTPSGDNYCHESRFPVPIGTIHQDYYCLTANFESCPIFRQRSEVAESPPVAVANIPVVAVPVASVAEVVELEGESTAIYPDFSPIPASSTPLPDETEYPTADLFDWVIKREPDFPIIDPNADVMIAPRRKRRANGRKLLVMSTVLIGLLLIGWWAWINFLAGAGDDQQTRPGRNGLPTLAPTADAALLGWGDRGTTESGLTDDPSDERGLIVEPALPLIEAEADDDQNAYLESIALTATALFAQSTPATCAPPAWWVQYIVQAEDTLESLALSRGISTQEIVQANCLTSNSLTAVALIYLPPLGTIITLPEEGTPTPVMSIPSIRRPTAVPTLPQLFVPTPTGLPAIIFPTPQSPVIITTNAPPPTATPVAPTNPPPPPPSPTSPPAATPTDPPEQPRPTATPPSLPSNEATAEPSPKAFDLIAPSLCESYFLYNIVL